MKQYFGTCTEFYWFVRLTTNWCRKYISFQFFSFKAVQLFINIICLVFVWCYCYLLFRVVFLNLIFMTEWTLVYKKNYQESLFKCYVHTNVQQTFTSQLLIHFWWINVIWFCTNTHCNYQLLRRSIFLQILEQDITYDGSTLSTISVSTPHHHHLLSIHDLQFQACLDALRDGTRKTIFFFFGGGVEIFLCKKYIPTI